MPEQCNCMGCQIGRGLLARPDFIAHYGDVSPKIARLYGSVASLTVNAALSQETLEDEFAKLGVVEGFDVIQEWCTHGCVIGAAITKGVSESEIVGEYDHSHKDLAAVDRAIRRHL